MMGYRLLEFAVAIPGLALLLFGASNGAWRLMYSLSILPLLGVGYVRRHLPETRRWSSLKDAPRLEGDLVGIPLDEVPGVEEVDGGSSPSKCHVKDLLQDGAWRASGFAKLSLIGGLLSLSAFAVAGYLGDRYGRKKLGVWGILTKTVVDTWTSQPKKRWDGQHVAQQGFLVLTAGVGGPLGLVFATHLVPYVGSVAKAARQGGASPEEPRWLLAYGQLICAGIVCGWLPETKGRELEDINS
eukprot:Skav200379  [mRNA]  locus=scaffold2518:378462:383616:- [translate_table: standard]